MIVVVIVAAVVVCCICSCFIFCISGGGAAYFGLKGKETDADEAVTTKTVTTAKTGTTAAVTGATFSSPTAKSTALNDNGGGNLFWIDRHSIECNDGINQLQLNNNGGKMKYDYKCVSASAPDRGAVSEVKGNWANMENGNAVTLDRITVGCGVDSVLNKVKFVNIDGVNGRYDYNCLKMNKALTCREASTANSDVGGGNAIYLDRQNITCNSDEALSSMKLVFSGDKYNYKYTCCK